MDKISTWLWCDGTAEEQAAFYTGLFADSAIVAVVRSPADNPGTAAGAVLTVEFTLAGRSFVGLNGGPGNPYTDAISLQVQCDDQAEVDLYWNAILAAGGSEVACGWITDRWGLRWQIVPRRMMQLLSDPAHGRRAMEAMMTMRKIDIDAIERAIAS